MDQMTGKLLLSVKLPAADRAFEVRVPLDMTVDEAAKLISSLLARREPACYEATPGADLMLCAPFSPAPGEELNPNETFRALVEQGMLVDGSAVALC